MTRARSSTTPHSAKRIKRPSLPVKNKSESVVTPDDDPLVLSTRDSYVARDDLEIGCMGSLSHAAILLEHEDQLKQNVPNAGVEPPTSTALGDGQSPDQARLARLCAAILDCLPTKSAAMTLQAQDRRNGGRFDRHCPTVAPFYEAFWQLHGDVFERPRDPERLEKLGQQLCRATERPLTPLRTNHEYLASICGENSRWELIGSMILEIGFVTWDLTDHDPLLRAILSGQQQPNKRSYCVRLLE